jgi:cyclophilin family peptidyl-prolyl cis-trans isomerase/HEAT repeat protein
MTVHPYRTRLAAGVALVSLSLGTRPAVAQDAGAVEAIAPMLRAEDARQWAQQVLEAGTFSADTLVRRVAAMSIGRIGDLRGTALLIPMLNDRDSTVQTTAAFALGLLRDTAATGPLIAKLSTVPPARLETAQAIVTALAKIGGPRAAEIIGRIVNSTAGLTVTESPDVLVRQAALEAWRLGAASPTRQLIALAQTDDDELRWRVIFSLGQLRAPEAGSTMLAALQDKHPMVRAYAARALTAAYVADAGLDQASVVQLLVQATRDDQAEVRVSALRSLGTFAQAQIADQIVASLGDAMPNVEVEAAVTMAKSGGPVAGAQLSRLVRETKGTFALQRAALLGLARVAPDSFRPLSAPWSASPRWAERAAAAEGWGWVAPGPDGGHPDFLGDPDGRVAAAALAGWSDAVAGPDPALLSTARRLLSHSDVGVRALAADAIARDPVPSDLRPLTAAYQRGLADSVPDAAIAALGALRALAARSDQDAGDVARGFIAASARPQDYVLRLWAESAWPALSRRWGPAYPVETRRTIEDYREIARRYVAVPDSPDAHPHVFIETDQRGTIEVELLGPEAPLTVLNFLTLVDRRFFDKGRWARVIPALIARDGDPRGDGWGGPGYTIRDEINQRRFDGYVLAMALAGPDTGGSQWFLTLGPQPQLDGRYTVFGVVVGAPTVLLRVTEGDQIRLVHR